MMTLRFAELAQVLDARLIGEDGAITAVSTDTRTLGAGALFVALRGGVSMPRFLRAGRGRRGIGPAGRA